MSQRVGCILVTVLLLGCHSSERGWVGLSDGAAPDAGSDAALSHLRASAITAGVAHTCAIVPGNGVRCWGLNENGQLGIGSTRDTPVAVEVPGVTSVFAIGAAYATTWAVLSRGEISAWGLDTDGQLGDQMMNAGSPSPVQSRLRYFLALAGGWSHACGILADESVQCWGSNASGALGDGSEIASTTPVRVLGVNGAIALAAGAHRTCALVEGGDVWCWGPMGLGPFTGTLQPAAVAGIRGATAITAGDYHHCALLSGGEVMCWGLGTDGQLGDGQGRDSWTPVRVTGLDRASAIAGGGATTCAVAGSLVWCWGDNQSGQLGNGVMGKGEKTPVMVRGLALITDLALGRQHACARTNLGEVFCWGHGNVGQLGAGAMTSSAVPVQVLNGD
jgi:alpha-tubulin suppressor-like RCC1 family protein